MKKGYIYIILSAFIFSTMEIAGKIVADDINPFQLNFLRFLIGALILLPLSVKDLKKRKIKLNGDDYAYFTLLGFLCVFVSMSFFQLAIVNTKASIVAIVFSCNPVFTIPFAYFILKENLSKATVASLIISLLGIGFILNPFSINSDITGIILSIVAAISFSLYGVIGKMRSAKYGSITLNCITFFIGDLIMLAFIAISNINSVADFYNKHNLVGFSNIPIFTGITADNILTLIYLGVVVTGLGYLFYFFAMDETSASTASIVFFIKPALAPILSLIILKEHIALNVTIGIICILIGSYITMKSKSDASKEELKQVNNAEG